MWHLRTVPIAALIAALAVAGCGSDDDEPSSSKAASTSAAADKPAKVAWLSYIYADYQQAEENGLKAAVEPGGGSVEVSQASTGPSQQRRQLCAFEGDGCALGVVLVVGVRADR